jgi:hypothetical protein
MQLELDEDDLKVVIQRYLDSQFINKAKVTEVYILSEKVQVELDKAPG